MMAPSDKGLVRLAQYLAGISAHQPIWGEITSALVQLLGVGLAAVGECDGEGRVMLDHWSARRDSDIDLGATAKLHAAVSEVLDSGFFALRRLPPGAAATGPGWELLFLPLSRGNQTRAVLMVGEQRASRYSKDELDFYLAIAGLAAVTAERLVGERELRQHRANLEELVVQRSAELVASNRRLQTEAVQREVAESALRAEKDNLLRILEAMDDLVAIIGGDYRIHYMNPALQQAVGDREAEYCYRVLNATDHPCEQCDLPRVLVGETLRGEWICTKNGRIYDRVMTALEHADGSSSSLAIMRDITERKRTEDIVRQMAYYDNLTGLPNRILFHDRLTVELARATRNQGRMAVMMLDLDRFKAINDSLGHRVGDKLLQAASRRMLDLVRGHDTIARIGGDEFMIILPDLRVAEDAGRVAAKLVSGFTRPFEIEGASLSVTASVGIAVYPDHGTQDQVLIEQADRAMYQAKGLGRSSYELARQRPLDAGRTEA
jgi:diguanylate cyclase (GGDEF)-like protein